MTRLKDGTVLVRRRIWRLTDGSCHIEQPGRDAGRDVKTRLERDPGLLVVPPRYGEDRYVWVPKIRRRP